MTITDTKTTATETKQILTTRHIAAMAKIKPTQLRRVLRSMTEYNDGMHTNYSWVEGDPMIDKIIARVHARAQAATDKKLEDKAKATAPVTTPVTAPVVSKPAQQQPTRKAS